MKRSRLFLGSIVLLGAILLAGCGKKATPTPEPIVETEQTTISWLAEPMQTTDSDFTVELVKVVQNENDLIVTIKYPLQDWRNWYISNISLDIGHEFSFSNPGAKLNEKLYQKGLETFCLQKAVDFYAEKCIRSSSLEPYQTVDFTFSGVPEVEEGTQIDLIIQTWSTELRKSIFCDDLPLTYIEEAVAQDFPGLTLNCSAEAVTISDDSGYADNLDAQKAVSSLVAFASEGRVTGWFEFEFIKQSQ